MPSRRNTIGPATDLWRRRQQSQSKRLLEAYGPENLAESDSIAATPAESMYKACMDAEPRFTIEPI